MTASVDATTDRLAHLIDSFVYSGGVNGPAIAAMAVLGDAEISEGLRAAETVKRLAAEHQWQTRLDSTWRGCSCGVLGCRLPEVLS